MMADSLYSSYRNIAAAAKGVTIAVASTTML
jgi:hypothetical protein